MQCQQQALRGSQFAIPSIVTAWPSQIRAVQCFRRNRVNIKQQASNISIGALEGGDDQQYAAPVDYAPKDPKKLWMAAIKIPMYSVGVVPVLVSAAGGNLS